METCCSKHRGPLPPCVNCVCLLGLFFVACYLPSSAPNYKKEREGFPSRRAAQHQLAEKPLLIDWAEFWDGACCFKSTSPLLSQRKQASLANATPALPH